MKNLPRFLVELVFVGIAFALLANLVSLFIPIDPTQPWKHAWLMPFIAGALGHLIFEVLGLNNYYAEYKVKE